MCFHYNVNSGEQCLFSPQREQKFYCSVLLVFISVIIKGNDPIDRSTTITMNCAINELINGLCYFYPIQYIRLALSHRLILQSHFFLSFSSYQPLPLYITHFHHGKQSLSHSLFSSHKESKEAQQSSRNVQLSKRTKHPRAIQFD